jgi:hypothetical protein
MLIIKRVINENIDYCIFLQNGLFEYFERKITHLTFSASLRIKYKYAFGT